MAEISKSPGEKLQAQYRLRDILNMLVTRPKDQQNQDLIGKISKLMEIEGSASVEFIVTIDETGDPIIKETRPAAPSRLRQSSSKPLH